MRARIFLDASALLAGAYASPTGAMRVLIRLTFADFYLLYTNEIAVEEAERALQRKAPEAVAVFRKLLAAMPMMIKPAPSRARSKMRKGLSLPRTRRFWPGRWAARPTFW